MAEVTPTAAEVGEVIEKYGREHPLAKAAVRERADALLASEQTEDPHWWWLSFATPDEFLGVALVYAAGYMTAVVKASALGINPGGEVAGWPLPVEIGDPPEHVQHVLLDKAAAESLAEVGWVSDGPK